MLYIAHTSSEKEAASGLALP